jgi:phosphoglucosamine mutase
LKKSPSSRRYFGTDGIRGPYGGPIVNESFAARLGAAVGRWSRGKGVALIGRDTRFSGESLALALAEGLRLSGLEPRLLGVIPTPGVSRAVRAYDAALGVVVTASHNPAGDNGIKFFDSAGRKLSDAQDAQIEKELTAESKAVAPALRGFGEGASLFAAGPASGAVSDYISVVSRLLPAGCLKGWRIVLDTANGATCVTSPAVFRALGAEVIGIGDAPDGHNINAGVGSEHPELAAARVKSAAANLGVAHDGDGDRCVLVDEQGQVLDGDELMAILATHALNRGALPANVLVATVQSNLGLDAAVAAAGGRVVRAPVGDRYVIEHMAAEGAGLGGESSGHIVFSAISSAGDGLVAALKVIEVMLATGQPLSKLRGAMKKFPQATASVNVCEKKPLANLPVLSAAIRALEADLGAQGRVMVRYSGTEPKLRLLVEGPDEKKVQSGLARLKEAISAETG